MGKRAGGAGSRRAGPPRAGGTEPPPQLRAPQPSGQGHLPAGARSTDRASTHAGRGIPPRESGFNTLEHLGPADQQMSV